MVDLFLAGVVIGILSFASGMGYFAWWVTHDPSYGPVLIGEVAAFVTADKGHTACIVFTENGTRYIVDYWTTWSANKPCDYLIGEKLMFREYEPIRDTLRGRGGILG